MDGVYSNRTYTSGWHALRKSIVTWVVLVGIRQSKNLFARESSELSPPTFAEKIRRCSAEIQHGEFERRQNKSSQRTWARFSLLWKPLSRQKFVSSFSHGGAESLENIWRWSDSLEGNDNCLNLLDEKVIFFEGSMATTSLPFIASGCVMAHCLPL